ncbi:hypothetical protein ATCC90586_008041 [Pythium insidiosum]|nr:hypothetical protein ATCC90586_008041 [Pythium insidiosum]
MMISSTMTPAAMRMGHVRRLIAPSSRASQRRTFAAPGGAGGIAGNKITGVVRFYKKVGVKEVEDEGAVRYAVTLDGKTLKTPMRSPLQLPSKSMGVAVAQEWDAQEERIKPALMPMMTLASTALDLEQTSSHEELIDEMLHYLHSDTVCYQVTADQQEKLAVLQHKKWDPLRKWFREQFDGELDVSHGSIGRLTHDAALVDGIRAALQQCDVFELVSLRAMTKECKSLITAWAVFKRHLTAKEAMDISRVEEEFQIGRWGLVEGGHDLDRVNTAVRLSSASFFLWLLQNKH